MKKFSKMLLFSGLILFVSLFVTFCAKKDDVTPAIPKTENTDISAEGRSVGFMTKLRATVTSSGTELCDVWVHFGHDVATNRYSAHFRPCFVLHCKWHPEFNIGNPALLPVQGGTAANGNNWFWIAGGSCDGKTIYDPLNPKKVIGTQLPLGNSDITVVAGALITVKLEVIDMVGFTGNPPGTVLDTKIIDYTPGTYAPQSYSYNGWTGQFN